MNLFSFTQNQVLDPIYLTYSEMKNRGFTEKKMGCYLYNIRRFLFSTSKSVDEINNEDVRSYLQSLLSKSQLNYIVVDSLKFFFNDVMRLNVM